MASTSASSCLTEGNTSEWMGLVWLYMPYVSTSSCLCSVPAMYRAPETVLWPSWICRSLASCRQAPGVDAGTLLVPRVPLCV